MTAPSRIGDRVPFPERRDGRSRLVLLVGHEEVADGTRTGAGPPSGAAPTGCTRSPTRYEGGCCAEVELTFYARTPSSGVQDIKADGVNQGWGQTVRSTVPHGWAARRCGHRRRRDEGRHRAELLPSHRPGARGRGPSRHRIDRRRTDRDRPPARVPAAGGLGLWLSPPHGSRPRVTVRLTTTE